MALATRSAIDHLQKSAKPRLGCNHRMVGRRVGSDILKIPLITMIMRIA